MIKRLFASLILCLLLLAVPSTALAVPQAPGSSWVPSVVSSSLFSGVDCSGKAAHSAVCTDSKKNGDPVAGSNGVLLKIVNLMAVIAGVAAVIVIIVSGLKLVQAGGNSDDVTSARRGIIYAAVGLIIIVLARTLIALALGTI